MKKVSYYSKGTTVYYFDGFSFKLKETIVIDVQIKVPDTGDAEIMYTLDSGEEFRANLKLDSRLVFDDREELKKIVLKNFSSDTTEQPT